MRTRQPSFSPGWEPGPRLSRLSFRTEGSLASKRDFSADEWMQLQHGLAGTVLLVSVSDPGLFDTFKEAGAAAKHLRGRAA